EDVIGLRTAGQRGPRRFDLAARSVGVTAVEQRDAEIQPCDPETGIELERLPERRCGRGKVVLLEMGDADVVRTVRVFARRHRRRAGRRLNANRTTQSRDGRDGRDRDKESSATCGSTHGWLYRPRCG